MLSEYLSGILKNHNGITNMQVAFFDVESYSKRRTAAQVQVIDAFTECLKKSLEEIAKKYIDYWQKNNINMSTDLILIPTGDGVAVVFSFEGLHDIHFEFAKNFLNYLHQFNGEDKCSQFEEDGWCNCHPFFNVRVGLSEGKGIIYKDINDKFNVAGNVINMAARVMGIADRNQLILTEDAYRQLIDMVESPNLHKEFRLFSNVEIKHKFKINVFQYIGNEPYINDAEPEALHLKQKSEELKQIMQQKGFPMMEDEIEIDRKAMLDFMGQMVSTFDTLPIKNKR